MIVALAARVAEYDPQFADGQWPSRVQFWSARAVEAHTSPERLGNRYIETLAYWVLHHLTQELIAMVSPLANGRVGAIQSIRTGDETLSFAPLANVGQRGSTDADFQSTLWGRRYQAALVTSPAARARIV